MTPLAHSDSQRESAHLASLPWTDADAVEPADRANEPASTASNPAEAVVVDLRGRFAPSMTDFELLAGCVNSPELFAELYRRHSSDVLRYAMRRVGCAQTAADITSETFAAAFAGRESFRQMDRPAVAWLIGIARNMIGRYARRAKVSRKYQRRLAVSRVELGDGDLARVEDLADMDALRADIEHALARIPQSQSEAVRLRICEDKSYEETAAALGISEGATRVRVSRGLTRLHELLAELEDRS